MCVICLSLDKDWITIDEAREHLDQIEKTTVKLDDHAKELRTKVGHSAPFDDYEPDFRLLDDDNDPFWHSYD